MFPSHDRGGNSENTIYAYVTDVGLYLKFLDKKKIDICKSDKLTIMSYIQNLISLGKSERSINRIQKQKFHKKKEIELLRTGLHHMID